jgi:putative membrane protein
VALRGLAAGASPNDPRAGESHESHADKAKTGARAAASGAAMTPEAVLADLHATNQLEIQAGQLAQAKGTSSEVKSFGKQLAADHSSADDKVMALAEKKNLNLRKEPSDPQEAKKDAQEIARLQKLSGAEFDRAFLTAMENGHQKTIAKLEKAKSTVQDQDIQKLVDELMPVLNKHRATASEARQDLSSGTARE